MPPTLKIHTTIKTAQIIGAWIQQTIEPIPGNKTIDIYDTPTHKPPGYTIHIDITIDQHYFRTEYHNKLEYRLYPSGKHTIDLADPTAAKQLQENIANNIKTKQILGEGWYFELVTCDINNRTMLGQITYIAPPTKPKTTQTTPAK